MLNDLISNYNLKGKNVRQIIKLLGNPDNYCDHNQYEFGYTIKLVDNPEPNTYPVKIKSLVLELDKSKPKIDTLTIITKVYLTE
ncbi:MAG: hypothetical protein JXQ93_03120 [Flavobacteriaceae bacterium]